MSKYKILWNDDEAEKYASRPELQEYPEFVFEFEKYQDICLQKLKDNADQYDAAILDANGISTKHPERIPNKGEYFHTLVDKACENKRLRTFVFSGQLHFDSSDPNESGVNNFLLEKGFVKGKNLFPKTMFEEMLEQLRDDLDDYNAWGKYYDEDEFLLDFVEHGWLSREQRSQNLDPIMKALKERDFTSNVGNNMRHILRYLLWACNEKYNIVFKPKTEIEILSTISHMVANNPDISPFTGSLWGVHYYSNAKSHVTIDPKLLDLFFDTTFGAFRLAANFFHKVMTGNIVLKNNQPKEIIEKEDQSQAITLKIDNKDDSFIYSGDYQIVIRKGWEDRLTIDSVIKVYKYVNNTDKRNSYKYFVMPFDYGIIDEK